MNPTSIAVAIYALGAVIATAYTLHAFRVVRESDEQEDADILRPINAAQQSSGIQDSGLAVFSGLIWPLVVPRFVALRVRNWLGR